MVKKTVDLYECDVCGDNGERYTITYPDGLMATDRCLKHASKILAFKDEQGTWTPTVEGRGSFKISSLEDIERQRRG